MEYDNKLKLKVIIGLGIFFWTFLGRIIHERPIIKDSIPVYQICAFSWFKITISSPQDTLLNFEQKSVVIFNTPWYTWYLSFLLHRQHFRIPNFTPHNWAKTPQNTQKYPWNVKYMKFLCSISKILHLAEYFYTGTAHGARDNYQVWAFVNVLN